MTGEALDAPDRLGFATVCISTPGGGWSWNVSIINETLPRDCSKESAGQDYIYFEEGLDFTATLPFYAPTGVCSYGFSQVH